ncbi:MAG: ABC-F family ATP-binding cassette domain-containing protein [Sedimentisphaerales bacterium]|nr:ABC-F family ATP-binding cassette domain-containing protein [Sedimentisphaerales bacterium]
MPIVSLNDIHIQFGRKAIFDSLALRLYPKQKVGLVGPNGCGKTTLLKLILSKELPDKGNIHMRKNITIGYLPQEPSFDNDKTVRQELHAGADEILQTQNEIHSLAEEMEQYSGKELARRGGLASAMKQYDRLLNRFESIGGYRFENKMKEIVAGVGVDDKFIDVKTHLLSGGQKSRLGLAKVLLADADLLLLDEPTNHLDWDATIWLENYLSNFNGAALIVSHDRYLLDRLVTKIVEIRNCLADVYPGNYSNFRQEKQKRDLERQRQHAQRVDFVERTRDFIARNKDQEGMSKVARGRKTQLNKLLKNNPDFLEKPKSDNELDFKFAEVEQKSKRSQAVLTCNNLSMKYDELTLFESLNLEVLTGHRLGIIGPNGAGKTTLLKIALGKIKPTAGSISMKKNLSVGYLDQAGAELNEDNTVLEEASSILPDSLPENMRSKLGAFLFSGEDVFKKISQLSGGERNRLALCKLVLAAPQILILDEPTNHLDIPSIEALENALQNYTGTIIVISHDRFFLDKTVDQLLVLGVDKFGKKTFGRFELVIGSVGRYTEILQKRQAEQDAVEKDKTKKPKRHK